MKNIFNQKKKTIYHLLHNPYVTLHINPGLSLIIDIYLVVRELKAHTKLIL